MSAELEASPSGVWSTSKDPIAAAREDLYGRSGASMSGSTPGSKPLMFSYASPEAVKQAKMENMQHRISQSFKDVMARLSAGSSLSAGAHAGREGSRELTDASILAAEQQKRALAEAGGIDQFAAWVQPPRMEDDGRELNTTSKLIVKGQKQMYQHLQVSTPAMGLPWHHAAGPNCTHASPAGICQGYTPVCLTPARHDQRQSQQP